MMLLFLLLIFVAAAAAIWFQGLWGAAVTFVNLLLAMMLATSFFEPLCTALEGVGLASFTYLLDFVVLWFLFAIAYGILRAITDSLSRTQVAFDLPVEMAGRSVLAALCGWLVVCFVAFSLQTAPLNSESPLGAWSSPTSPTMLVTSPDRLWLGFMYSRSLGAFAGGTTFDENAQFPLKYHDRRKKFFEAPEMRVAK